MMWRQLLVWWEKWQMLWCINYLIINIIISVYP